MTTIKDYARMVERTSGEDENEYMYRVLMGLKGDLLDYLRRNPSNTAACASVNESLEQINEAARVYEVVAYAKLYGTEDSDDELEEEDVAHQPAEEIFSTVGDTVETYSTEPPRATYDDRLNFHISDEEPKSQRLDLVEIGAAKLREYAKWIHAHEGESDAEEKSANESTQVIFSIVDAPLEARILEHTTLAHDEGQITNIPDSRVTDVDEEWELARIGLAKIWEYAQGLGSSNENAREGEEAMPESETEVNTDANSDKLDCLYDTIEIGLLEMSPPFKAYVEENLEFELNVRTVEPCSTNKNWDPKWTLSTCEETKGGGTPDFASQNDYYEIKSGREALIEGRVFDVGKNMWLADDTRDKRLKTSPTTDANPKTVKAHESQPIDPGKDPGVPSIPLYKSKEEVNSSRSRVWKLKIEELNEFEETYDSGWGFSSKGETRESEVLPVKADLVEFVEGDLKTFSDMFDEASPREVSEYTLATDKSKEQIPFDFYMTKLNREEVMKGRVFDVGKDVELTNDVGYIEFEDSMVEEVCSSNGKSRTTNGQNDNKRPWMDPSPLPKRVEAHDDMSIDPGKDPGESLRPSHKLKEKVNSKCSRVWKVKDKKSNQAWMVKNKSGGKPLAFNKRLKRGWDPPAIYSF